MGVARGCPRRTKTLIEYQWECYYRTWRRALFLPVPTPGKIHQLLYHIKMCLCVAQHWNEEMVNRSNQKSNTIKELSFSKHFFFLSSQTSKNKKKCMILESEIFVISKNFFQEENKHNRIDKMKAVN